MHTDVDNSMEELLSVTWFLASVSGNVSLEGAERTRSCKTRNGFCLQVSFLSTSDLSLAGPAFKAACKTNIAGFGIAVVETVCEQIFPLCLFPW